MSNKDQLKIKAFDVTQEIGQLQEAIVEKTAELNNLLNEIKECQD